jgi:hypothetical protein
MIGRVMRPEYDKSMPRNSDEQRKAAIAAGPKPKAVVIDPVSNWERCGFPTWPRHWSLEDVEKNSSRAKKKDDTRPQRVCLSPSCNQPFDAYKKVCPYCGHPAIAGQRNSVKAVDGDLEELDVRAMNALFGKLKQANMSDREFQQDQVRRRVPMKGRLQELRRFKAAKKRREVLREMMAWWMGLQPNRSQAEIQKRFYLRFGVDVVTALTLNETQTNELIDLITTRFKDDLYESEQERSTQSTRSQTADRP